MLARTLKESFRGNLDYHCHENRRVNLISACLQFSLTLKNLYIVPTFFERYVDLSYDRNFQEKIIKNILILFIPAKLPHIKFCTIDYKRYSKTK